MSITFALAVSINVAAAIINNFAITQDKTICFLVLIPAYLKQAVRVFIKLKAMANKSNINSYDCPFTKLLCRE